MNSRWKTRMIRTAAVLVFGTGLAVSSAVAQQDAPPADQGAAQGQGFRGHREGVERHVAMLQKRLNLTPDQTTQIRSILTGSQNTMEALRHNNTLTPQDRRTQMMTLHQDSETKIRAALTTEQAATYDQMLAQQRQRMQNRGAGANGGGDSSQPAAAPQQ